MSLHGLKDQFFLGLNDITLSGCTAVYLSVHLLKAILVTSRFLAIMNEADINIHMLVFELILHFQLLLVNAKEHNC